MLLTYIDMCKQINSLFIYFLINQDGDNKKHQKRNYTYSSYHGSTGGGYTAEEDWGGGGDK